MWVGYYDLVPFESESEVRRYLSPGNMRLAFGGGLRLTERELRQLADLAIESGEGMLGEVEDIGPDELAVFLSRVDRP